MFLKAINEEDIKNEKYIQYIITDNFMTLVNDGIAPDKDNQISNAIMSIALNRLLCRAFSKNAFRSNEREISKYLDNAEFYEINLGKRESFDEDFVDNSPYLKRKKLNIQLKDKSNDEDILIEDKISYSRFNHYVDLVNNVLVDEADINQYDYYKSQYLYLTLLWFEKMHIDFLDGDVVKPLDSLLDQMRAGLEEHRVEIFLTNAKNHYYNLNPYGELRPIPEMDSLEGLIDELNTHDFDKNVTGEISPLVEKIRRFQTVITKKDIPNEKRVELLEDSDFQNIIEFYKQLKEGRIDEVQIARTRKIENLMTDFQRLIDTAGKLRDR